MKLRSIAGGALGLTVVATFVLTLVGVGLFYLVKIMGGSIELEHACDAGTLSLAKDAIEVPSVALQRAPIEQSFGGLIDSHTGGINLQTFNRAVGQVALVALNAQADGNPLAIANARQAIQAIEGPSGIGARLSTKLSAKGPDNAVWAQTAFTHCANRNSLRMVGDKKSTPKLEWAPGPTTYGVAYVKADTPIESLTNVELTPAHSRQMPFKDYRLNKQVSWPANATGKSLEYTSIRGYEPIEVAGVGTICGVSMSPFEQPHLISKNKFANSKINPVIAAGLTVPPNAIETKATVADVRTQLTMDTTATSTVGTAVINKTATGLDKLFLPDDQPKYPLSIPRGYLIIDNNGSGMDSSYTGLLPQPNTKAAPWFGTGGVSVDAPGSGCFSNNGQVERWMRHNFNVLAGVPSVPPSLVGLYNAEGHSATPMEARTISPKAVPYACNCIDLNSDPKASGANPVCVKYAMSVLNQPGPFDTAYYPNYLNPPAYGKAGAQYSAGELVKMKIWDAFNGGSRTPVVAATTGARLYPVFNSPLDGLPTPYTSIPGTNNCFSTEDSIVYPPGLLYSSHTVPGQVSRDGSILDLMEQVCSHELNPLKRNGKAELKRFLENRLLQIKPEATQKEMDELIEVRKIALNKVYYLYMDSKRKFQLDTQPPSWLDATVGMIADGTPHDYHAKEFDLVPTLANPPFDFDIHNIPFLTWSPSHQKDMLSATFTPASGAYNLLGVVKFEERTYDAGSLTTFWHPN